MRTIFTLAVALAGASAPLAAQRRPASAAHASPAASGEFWQASVGFSAGFTNTYIPAAGQTLTFFAAPGIGTDPALGVGGISSPPVLFAIFPLHGRFAVEPAIEIHNLSSGSSGVTTATLAARLDYALSRAWYAAVGGQLYYADGGTVQGETAGGASLATGLRFHLTGPVGGRFEMGYSFKGGSTNTFSAQSLTYLFGLTVPIH